MDREKLVPAVKSSPADPDFPCDICGEAGEVYVYPKWKDASLDNPIPKMGICPKCISAAAGNVLSSRERIAVRLSPVQINLRPQNPGLILPPGEASCFPGNTHMKFKKTNDPHECDPFRLRLYCPSDHETEPKMPEHNRFRLGLFIFTVAVAAMLLGFALGASSQ